METKPTHEQAQLQLQLFELRREPRLREARNWVFKNYIVESFDDSLRVAPPGSEGQQLLMMVLSYWDQACAMLNYGLLHEDLFFETTGEFFGVWESVKPAIPEGRKRFQNPGFAQHLEKAAKRFEEWSEKRSPGQIAAMRQMMRQMRGQQKKAA
jgi:hypothetical protein